MKHDPPCTYAKLFSAISVIFLLLLFQDCGGGSTNVVPYNSSQHIMEQDFKVTPDPWQENMFRSELDKIDEFKVEDDSVLNTAQEELTCLFNTISENASYRKVDERYELSINDTDITHCFDMPGLANYSVSASYFLSKLLIVDDNDNPVELEQISLTEMAKYQIMANFRIIESNSRIYMKMSYEFTIDQKVYVYDFVMKSSKHRTGKFDEPCQLSQLLTNCTNRNISRLDITDFPDSSVDLFELNANDLVIVNDKPYFINGSILFKVNNWDGTMTYDDNGDTPPTYEATDGANIIQGTYGETLEHSHDEPKHEHTTLTTQSSLDSHVLQLRKSVYQSLNSATLHAKTLK